MEGILVSFYVYCGVLLIQLIRMLSESMDLFNLLVLGM